MVHGFALWYNIIFVQPSVQFHTYLITDLCSETLVKSSKILISDYLSKVKNELSYLTAAVYCN